MVGGAAAMAGLMAAFLLVGLAAGIVTGGGPRLDRGADRSPLLVVAGLALVLAAAAAVVVGGRVRRSRRHRPLPREGGRQDGPPPG